MSANLEVALIVVAFLALLGWLLYLFVWICRHDV